MPLYNWCKDEILKFVGGNEVTFISAASISDQNGYYKKAKESLGIKLNHLILDENPEKLIEKTKVFLVGGGNTFNLLKKLKEHNLLDKIKQKVSNGTLYIGISAGANIAGPNILTTNDWNVAELSSFDSLNLVPFNINPHYINPHDKSFFSGENRDDRIFEYHVFKNNPVVAVEEKTMLEVNSKSILIKGFGKVKVFMPKKEIKTFESGSNLDFLF
ncbi:MAG: dipeptidase [Candidatus Levybacteria bacterium]|nr:dipeptidase [Candidatus Levybacteria bacterium]